MKTRRAGIKVFSSPISQITRLMCDNKSQGKSIELCTSASSGNQLQIFPTRRRNHCRLLCVLRAHAMAAEGISRACFYLLIPETVSGILTSLLIMLAVLKNLLTGVTMRTKDKILCPLSISHLLFTVLFFVNVYHQFFHFRLSVYMRLCIDVLISYCVWSGTSLTLCLCFLHVFQIIQFSSRLFSLVSKKVDALMPWMILAIQVAALCGSALKIILSGDIQQGPSTNSSVSPPPNMTGENSFLKIFFQIFLTDFDWLILVIFCTTITLVVLAGHVCRRGKSSSAGDSIDEARKVIKSEIRVLIFYITFFIVMGVVMAHRLYGHRLAECLADVFVFAFPSLHCLIIIYNDSRYRGFCTSLCMGKGARASKS